jgi:hypothetical protein
VDRWKPPIETTKKEQLIMKRLGRVRALFGFGSRSFASGQYLGNSDHLTSVRVGCRGTTPAA